MANTSSSLRFDSFAMGSAIEVIFSERFEYRHSKAVDKVACDISIAAGEIWLEWRNERRARLNKLAAETDAKAACERERLTGRQIRLPDGAVVTVERHNGYVMSGWDIKRGWWAIDLRNDKATLVA